MRLRDFFCLPKSGRRTQNEARSGVDPVEGRSGARLAIPRPTESAPDLRIGTSTSPTPSPLTPRERESNDPGIISNQILSVPGRDQSGLQKSPDYSVNSGAAPGSKSDRESAAHTATELAVNPVNESSDVSLLLKSVAGGLSAILNHCEQTIACRQAIESVIPRVERLAESLKVPVPEGEVKEEGRRSILKRELDNIHQEELTLLEERSKDTSFLNNTQDVDKLGGLVDDIRDAMMVYQTSLQQEVYNKSSKDIESAVFARLDRMSHVADAGYLCGGRQGCMKGTRRDVLIQLESWLNDEEDKHVFWLNGLAGTGKSTITQTFAEMSFADGKLGASFFCSRDFENRRDLQKIFPTLAFQLAHRYPRFREELIPVLTASPDVGRESLFSQMEKLIVGPLKTTHDPTLIIIDALDECTDEDPASAILSILSRCVRQIPRVKFFITGRPEHRIRAGFRLTSLQPITEVFKLHGVERISVDADIKLFFRTRLTEIAENRSDCNFTKGWPRSSNINVLCEKAGGLFIYASTAVKFVESPHHQPPKRLALLVSFPQDTAHEGGTGIDSLYTGILSHAYRGLGPDNQQIYHRFRAVIGAVLLAFNPLSIESLSSLLRDFDTSDISIALNPLHSLLLVPEDIGDLIRVFHKSFPDFLTNPKRCQDMQFFVDPSVHHTEILLSCLHLMEEKLRKNICGLDDYVDVRSVDDLPARRKAHIGDALEYACRFWTKHLVKSPSSSPDAERVQEAIDRFFKTHLLFWIEVLIIMGNLDVSIYSINDIRQWYISGGFICKWTDDSQHFILEHFDTICNLPSQIYHYALPFSPSSSQLRKCYIAESSREVKVVKGTKAKWGTCSRTVLLGSSTPALSYWNNTIAVGSVDGDIIILHAITGNQTAVFSGHKQGVTCFTFSSDGKSFVSGSNDKTVKLWDVQTGGVIKPFHGHTKQVQSVSISADCTTIVSGSTDNTICLWDIETGECLSTIKQHGPVSHVSFSPMNPQHIISILYGKVWTLDAKGHKIPPTYNGTHISFSPDHAWLALCHGKVVTVRNSDSGETVAEFHINNDLAKYCCFSSDSRLIAAAAGNTAYVWNLTSPNPCLIATFVGHNHSITSLTFSSPSSLISASKDSLIKFWQVDTISTDTVATDPESTPPTLPPIKSVSLQAKDGVAISNDANGLMKMWDISNGHCKETFQTPAQYFDKWDAKLIKGRLTSVWYKDNEIHIWDAKREETLKTLHSPGCDDLKILGDGDESKILCLYKGSIQAWSMWTWELFGEKLGLGGSKTVDSLQIDGSRAWICSDFSPTQMGWDFGVSGSSPVPFHPSTEMPRFIRGVIWESGCEFCIKDTVTGKEVFQLGGRYAYPNSIQWDGQYLVTGYASGEVLILDFHYVLNRDV